MTAKQYLSQARDIKRDIERKHGQMQVLQSIAERATSSVEALRVSGTPNHSKLEDAVIRITELSDELAESMATYRDKYREISRAIDAVDNAVYRQLLSMRYLSFMTWEEIAVRMNYSYVHVVHNLHPRALATIERVNSI